VYNKNVYIYSGIQPGKKGTGNFLSFFIHQLRSQNIKFKLISFYTPSATSLISFAKKIGIVKYLRSIFLYISRRFSSGNKISNSLVILFHLQSLGLNNVANLILNNKVYIYVLDNFFFCKKSYNYIEGNKPCLKCLNSVDESIKNNCDFLLSYQNHDDYLNLLNVIKSNLDSILFLTQNDNQSEMIKLKFGQSANITKLGMLINLDEDINNLTNNKFIKYDFVYHNTNLDAKGISFFIQLAKLMPEYKFLVPYSMSDINQQNKKIERISNVDFISMTWYDGLKVCVENCKIVINPSIWSAPVEGALLKSIKFNGCVAIIPSDYSFQKEIPTDAVINLDTSYKKSIAILEQTINSERIMNSFVKKSNKWLLSYINDTYSNFDYFIREKLQKSSI